MREALIIISNQNFQKREDWQREKERICSKFQDTTVCAFHHKMDSTIDCGSLNHEKIHVLFVECAHSTIKTKRKKIAQRHACDKEIFFYSLNSNNGNNGHSVNGVKKINQVSEVFS